MNKKQKELLLYLLEELSNRYGCDGCNDLTEYEEELVKELDIKVEIEDDGIKMITPTQNGQLVQYMTEVLKNE